MVSEDKQLSLNVYGSFENLLTDVNSENPQGGLKFSVDKKILSFIGTILHADDKGRISYVENPGQEKFWVLFSRKFVEGNDVIEFNIYNVASNTTTFDIYDVKGLAHYFWVPTASLQNVLKLDYLAEQMNMSNTI